MKNKQMIYWPEPTDDLTFALEQAREVNEPLSELLPRLSRSVAELGAAIRGRANHPHAVATDVAVLALAALERLGNVADAAV